MIYYIIISSSLQGITNIKKKKLKNRVVGQLSALLCGGIRIYVTFFFFFPLKLFRIYTIVTGIYTASAAAQKWNRTLFLQPTLPLTPHYCCRPTLIIRFDRSTAHATRRKTQSTPRLTDLMRYTCE